jgi:2-dehydropantoate 2-reductase
MKFCIIGAGAMGASFGGLLKLAGHDVTLLDIWRAHVEAIATQGLRLDGVRGEHRIRLPAMSEPPAGLAAEVAMIWTDTNATRAAGEIAGRVLGRDGYAITLQNGIGNVETLIEVLGADRVAAGSSMCSAATYGPGHASLTHMGMTSLGEVPGGSSPRLVALADALAGAGFEVQVASDIMALVWTKFAINCAINALCATTGLRLGEVARLEATDRLQDLLIDEILAVTDANTLRLADPDLRATVRRHCWEKFSRPSMLQHIQDGKRTEIDALNMKLVEEGRRLGVPTPYNEALALLLKGVEFKATVARDRSEADYAALEGAVVAEARPVTGGPAPR